MLRLLADQSICTGFSAAFLASLSLLRFPQNSSKLHTSCICSGLFQGQVASTKEALQVANAEDFLQAAENDSLETKATQITQKWIKIADPCTFRLIAKNVTSLLPREQRELKVKTYKQLEELIQ